MAVVCPSCGTENPESAKFCSNCATSLADITRPAETRRTVTILFADVSGSTSLGEQLDPESLRALMSRYFAEMQAIIERHGGTLELAEAYGERAALEHVSSVRYFARAT